MTNNVRMLRGSDGFNQFTQILDMPEGEALERSALLQKSFMPFLVTSYYANLISIQEEPARSEMTNIVLPSRGQRPFRGRFDPYGNRSFRQNSRWFLQHKYPPTLLLHITDFCFSNCQFCYKVNEIRVEEKEKQAARNKVREALAYIDQHPEIDNILLTGGDPGGLNTNLLIECLDRLLAHQSIRFVRLATKVIAFDPDRLTRPELLQYFEKANAKPGKQVLMIAQINHPDEFSEKMCHALRQLEECRVQVRGQPTIAHGINDSESTLLRLHRRFIDNRIVPYYFTVFMPVRGVEQYAIKLHRAYQLMAAVKRQLNGPEKKSVLLASHDFGKFEICGFLPSATSPEQIVLKWHQAAMPDCLPEALIEKISVDAESLLVLPYPAEGVFCVDHLFERNGLPFIDSEGSLSVPQEARWPSRGEVDSLVDSVP